MSQYKPDSAQGPALRERREFIGWVATVVAAAAAILAIPATYKRLGILIAAGAVACIAGYYLVRYVRSLLDSGRGYEKQIRKILKDIESARNHDQAATGDTRELLRDIAAKLCTSERRCVVTIPVETFAHGIFQRGTTAYDRAEFMGCRTFVEDLARQIQQSASLGQGGAYIAADLRQKVRVSLEWAAPREDEQQAPAGAEPTSPIRQAMDRFRAEVVAALQPLTGPEADHELIILLTIRQGSYDSLLGDWLRALLRELNCRYVTLRQTSSSPDYPPPSRQMLRPAAKRLVDELLASWYPDDVINRIFMPLYALTAGYLELIKIRCAVLNSAADMDESEKLVSELAARGDSSRELRHPEALWETSGALGWLIDHKASRIGARSVAGAFDRLVLMMRFTQPMLGDLLHDLELGEAAAGLYEWLLRQELFMENIDEQDSRGISVSKTIRDAARAGPHGIRPEDKDRYRAAQAAAEQCYRNVIDLDAERETTPGYSGLERWEDIGWQDDVYAWISHARAIYADDPDSIKTFCICLFLDASWWWGDQVRLPFLPNLIDLFRSMSPSRLEWVERLAEFDSYYIPQWDLRLLQNSENWQHVGNAMSFIATDLGLRPGEPPGDPVLRRIYINWCFFSGDAACFTGQREAADTWYRQAGEAAGDAEDQRARRTFAQYQRADVWTEADPQRCLRTLQGIDAEIEALGDRSLRAYITRVRADCWWVTGDRDAAFDAYARAILHAYIYQVDQETPEMKLSEYTSSLYSEMLTRMAHRLTEARVGGQADRAAAALARTRRLFGPYWAHRGQDGPPATSPGGGLLDGSAPPLPGQADIADPDSDYARQARAMKEAMRAVLDAPVDQRLPS